MIRGGLLLKDTANWLGGGEFIVIRGELVYPASTTRIAQQILDKLTERF